MGLLNTAFWPALDDATARVFTASYGVLLVASLLWSLPGWRRFFVSERWGGYAQSSRETDLLQHPLAAGLGFAIWLACGALLIADRFTVAAALVNLILCRHAFVRMRWRSVARGMGAPGFMTWWLACAAFLVEYGRHHAPELLPLAVLVLQVDYAIIMLSSGIYKFTAGYPKNNGMELGMVNPEWGYWWQLFKKLSPSHPIYRVLNQLAWSTEVGAGILMLVPQTRLVGALLLMGSFVFIATQIRLAFLTEMVIVGGLLFFHAGSLPASLLASALPAAAPAIHPLPTMTMLLRGILWGYLGLLPFAHAGLFYNFYARRSFAKPLQQALERYTNFFGIIIWRVFSVDVINFFIQVYEQPRAGGARTLHTRYGIRHGTRFSHVAESIAITSLFTTLKYYPSNNQLFVDRLLRYARTIPRAPGALLVFEYVSIVKRAGAFEFVPAAEYTVDLEAATVEERILDPGTPLRQAHPDSPVHEGTRPGSYVALGS